jgi:hypothetical protein
MVEATASVSASEAYQEFEKRNNRFVNMLTDNVRKGNIVKAIIGSKYSKAGT